MNPTPDHHSLDPSLAALEYLLSDERGEGVAFEQQLLDDPAACECLADLVLVQQAAASIRDTRVLEYSSQPVPVRARRVPGWVTMLTGLTAMLLVGLWIGYQWGDHQENARPDSGMANDTQPNGSAPTGSSIIWHADLINTWSDLSNSTGESESTSSEDELDAAYAEVSTTELNAEPPVPDWMWAAVSISAMDEARELHEENEFEFEETL